MARQRLWAPQTEPNVDVDLVAPTAPALPLRGCAEWCAAANSSAGRLRSCQERCRAYPALQHHLGHLEAKGWAESVSAPAGSGITFACFYAQGDRGTEVRRDALRWRTALPCCSPRMHGALVVSAPALICWLIELGQ